MKKKFIMLTLCFTLIFSSLNYKKTYAMDLVITPSMFYTVSALAVAYGLTIVDTDSLYNLSREFVDFCGDTYDDAIDLFNKSVSFTNGVVTVGKEFLDKFDSYLIDNKSRIDFDSKDFDYFTYKGYPCYKKGSTGEPYYNYAVWSAPGSLFSVDRDKSQIFVNDIMIYDYSKTFYKDLYLSGFYINNGFLIAVFDGSRHTRVGSRLSDYLDDWTNSGLKNPLIGNYDNSKVLENVDSNGSLGLVLSPNVDSLIGKNSSDIIYDGTNVGVYDGSISVPNVSNPSISVEGDMSFPSSNTGEGSQTVCSECGLVGTHSSTCSKVNTGNPPIGLPDFPSWGSGIDFSPITQIDISDKFPFCLAKDIGNLISVFDVGEKEPIFDVPFLGEVYQIDLAQFTIWADIIKFFTLLGFIFGLIKITRGIIG